MKLKRYGQFLLSLHKTIHEARIAGLTDCATKLDEMFELINDAYQESIDYAKEIKSEQKKGEKNG